MMPQPRQIRDKNGDMVDADCHTCANRPLYSGRPCPPYLVNVCQPSGKVWRYVNYEPGPNVVGNPGPDIDIWEGSPDLGEIYGPNGLGVAQGGISRLGQPRHHSRHQTARATPCTPKTVIVPLRASCGLLSGLREVQNL